MTLFWAGSHDLPQYSSKLPGAGFIIDTPSTTSNNFVDLEDGTISSTGLDVITLHRNKSNDDINHLARGDWEGPACQGTYDDQEEFPDEDTIPRDQNLDRCRNSDNINLHAVPLPSEPSEDDTDSFLVNLTPMHLTPNVSDIPEHHLVIYAMVCWLYMQVNLPCIACNGVLVVLACLVMFLNLQLVGTKGSY